MNISGLVNSDMFFYYGLNPINDEIESDLIQGLAQPKHSMYYFRQNGCGVSDYQNYPNGLALQIQMRYEVVKWIAFRNTYVNSGATGTDRRVASSQSAVGIKQNSSEMDIDVYYIPFYNYKNPNVVSIPLGKK